VRLSYQWELRLAPWSYEWTYRLWCMLPALAGPLMALLSLFTNRRIKRWVAESQADAVVSTYPLASLALGRARKRGRLPVPVATFITDFAVHPLWAAPGVDLHLTVHPQAAASAHRQTGAAAASPGPMVSDRFAELLPSRAEARARLGLPDDANVALLVAGSWGVGAIRRTFDDIVATGSWLPLAVCGRNEHLQHRLTARGAGWVYGWTDQMPTLMAAADVLVENAGGLTCMEAFAAGLPVVSYRPIAGHGGGNAREMQAAGVAAFARPGELHRALDDALGPVGAAHRAAGQAMYAGDAAHDVIDLADWGVRQRVVVPLDAGRRAGRVVSGPGTRRPAHRRPAVVALTGVASLTLAVGLTSVGAGIAAAHGVAVAHPPAHATDAYVALRLGPEAAGDARVAPALASAHVTAIVSGSMAASDPIDVAMLAVAGVDVANGGWGAHRGLAWTWHADVQRSADAIRDATGGKVRTYAPGRRIDGLSLVSASWEDQRVVLCRSVLVPSGTLPTIRPGGVYVLDVRTLTPDQVLGIVDQIDALEAGGQQVAPLSALKG
jgi:UDP-N-acetylglucosamine:LPS N-acetylglucosamine transferase